MKTYTTLGTTDSELVCGLCGRDDLKSTVALRDNEDGSVVYFGSECASRATGWTTKEVALNVKAADTAAREAAEAERQIVARAEQARWDAWLLDQTGISDTFGAIQALGGFAAARKAYAA